MGTDFAAMVNRKEFTQVTNAGATTTYFTAGGYSSVTDKEDGRALGRQIAFLLKLTGAGASSVTTITVELLNGTDIYVVSYDFYAADGTYTADTKSQATTAGANGNFIINLPKAPCLGTTRLKLVNSGVAPAITYDCVALIADVV